MRTHRRVYRDEKRERKARERYEAAIAEAYETLFAITVPARRACDDAVAVARQCYAQQAGPYHIVLLKGRK